MPEGNSSCTGQILGVGLLRVDRCCSSCSTLGGALAEGACKDLGRCKGLGMQLGGCREGWGRFF